MAKRKRRKGQRSTKLYTENQSRATRTLLKSDVNLDDPKCINIGVVIPFSGGTISYFYTPRLFKRDELIPSNVF